jgi:hypothetical protein
MSTGSLDFANRCQKSKIALDQAAPSRNSAAFSPKRIEIDIAEPGRGRRLKAWGSSRGHESNRGREAGARARAYEIVADKRTGKSSAENLKPA